MNYLLFFYQRPEPATWVFLSSFLLLSFYFVFHRVFSIRNLDLLLLLLLAWAVDGLRRQEDQA